MAIVKTFTPGENTFLLVWKITEDAETLNKYLDHLTDAQTTTPKHSLHWLASRAAITTHFGLGAVVIINKDIYNRPSMLVDGEKYHLSITHSSNYAAVMFSKFRNVALDLEKVDERVGRVAHKFINSAEEEMLLQSKNIIHDQTLIWSAKETLYKFYGQKELDFKKHMTIFTQQPQLRGCLHKTTPIFYDMNDELLDGFILTYMSE
ncbi:MAG: 4'-phosphopantetheinyl transferase family protein [Bacteroidia bacterium]